MDIAALIDFVSARRDEDTASLALSRDKFPGIDIATACECIEASRKLRVKCPRWARPDIICPSALSAEQCSSEETARYKAALAAGFRRVADLTGGLGVDFAAIAYRAEASLYNDMNPLLVEAARHNFAQLGLRGVEFSCREITPESVLPLLRDFRPDLVYIDPARRSKSGGKVFLLKDCTPDLPSLLPALRQLPSVTVIAKISPMADITALRREIGPGLREIHVVGAAGECKELLLVIEPGFTGEPTVVKDTLRFTPSEEVCAPAAPVRLPKVGEMLFEPDKALLKAGCPKLLCSRFGLERLGGDVPVFICSDAEALKGHGRLTRVLECTPFSKRAAITLARQHPDAELLCRGLRIDTDTLRKSLPLVGGASLRLLALGLGRLGNHLILTETI